MISNEVVRRLIAADRETLLQLMALSREDGMTHFSDTSVWKDPDICALLDDVRERNRTSGPGQAKLKQWNEVNSSAARRPHE